MGARDSNIRLRRAYEDPADADGFRVLVDRVWPRGVTKAQARIDLWCKEVAPSTELRRWFGHEAQKFTEFARRYRAELDGSEALEELRTLVRERATVTLVYGAKDTEHNQAVVLRDLLT